MAVTPDAKAARQGAVAKSAQEVTPPKTARQARAEKPAEPSDIAKAVRHLEAGEWQAAHALVQKDATLLGCWAHGLVHLIEGDLEQCEVLVPSRTPAAPAWEHGRRGDRRVEGGGAARDAVSAAGPSQGANRSPSGAAQRRQPQAWGLTRPALLSTRRTGSSPRLRSAPFPTTSACGCRRRRTSGSGRCLLDTVRGGWCNLLRVRRSPASCIATGIRWRWLAT